METSNPNTENERVHIDVESVLESKLPSLKGKLPKFLISYLKKIIHEDEINYIFNTYGHLYGVEFADTVMNDHFHINIQTIGEENLPDHSNIIFACNHPLGGFDGIALISLLGKRYNSIKIPVNDILMYVKNLQEHFIPVNKIQGRGQSRDTAHLIDNVCASDAPILFFPAGQCSRRQPNGVIQDNEWKKTFISKAKEYKRDIVPIHFIGENSKFFYNLSYYRMKLGIKANIEMLFLSDELFKQKNKSFSVIIGKPISYQSLTNEKSDREWAEEIKKISYRLTSNT